MFKVNLHFHSAEDTRHALPYTLEEALQYANECGFGALALTFHKAFGYRPEYEALAAQYGITLIPGIEAEIEDDTGRGSHVVILNCDASCEQVRTFDDLRTYKEAHPESFILAPHPFSYGYFSLHENLEKHIDLFDAIEHTWFYTPYFDRNVRAKREAEKYGKPFIATSDTHFLDVLYTDYTLVDAADKNPQAIFEAIRRGKFQLVTKPRSFWGTFVRFGWFTLWDEIKVLRRRAVAYKQA